ncbi:MAG: hypothetical protein GX272_08615 [Epulopiscium sp.]|nr:hypothetical protein [Candidatus Epulonipiscium sp.]
MITRHDSLFHLICDICGEKADEYFLIFNDAVQYKKNNGWKSQKRNGEWEEICPNCQDGEV